MRRNLWLLAGWMLVVGFLTGYYVRSASTSNPYLIALISISPLLVFPLGALLLSAWRAGARSLRVAAAVLTLLYITTFTSVGAVVGCSADSSVDELVLFSHNVQRGHGDPSLIAGSADASDADVLVFQEVWPEFYRNLEADPRLADYRYRSIDSTTSGDALVIWSRLPATDATIELAAGKPVLRIEIETPGGPLTLRTIHTSAPVGRTRVHDWTAQLEALAQHDTATPSIMAGDFNATMDHAQFRALLDAGWTDAHGPKGCGLDATWPTGKRGPSLLRLDHVLVSDHFEVLGVRLGPGNGSDHKSVTATFRFTSPSQT